MVITQTKRAGRTKTGSIYTPLRKKRKYEMGRRPTLTGIGEKNVISPMRAKFNQRKVRVRIVNTINVLDKNTNKYVQAKVKSVKENAANRNFVRMNVLTKGSIVDTELGKVCVTSRPGQHGTVNGILVK